MPKLPAITAKELISALKKAGFIEAGQKGSHLKLINLDNRRRVIVPLHAVKSIRKGTLNAILKGADISKHQLVELL
ncbi:MAG: type II toxin-antitoxin system HicA family toxin [bacterium]